MGIKELREKAAKLQAEARAKQTEIKDDTPAERAQAIESEHRSILAELEKVNTEIATLEAAERAAQTTQPAAAQATQSEIDVAVQRALDADLARQSEIRKLGATAKMPAQQIEEHIRQRTTIDAFRTAAFDWLVKNPANNAGPVGGTQIDIIRDEGETRRQGMVDALAARMARAGGERNVQIPDHARAYGEMGLVEIAAECIGYGGALRTARQVGEVMERAFEFRAFAGHSVSDFPAIFLDAMNKRLLARYQTATPTYRLFCAPYTAVDFRSMNVIRAGDFPSLQPVAENGEIKAGTFSESKEKFQVSAYGVMLNISRQMIVNDSLGAIDQVLSSAGIRVSDWENAQAFAVLVSNSGVGPTMLTDNAAMFHASHGNLAGAGAAIAIDSVGSGRAAMMKQKTLDGITANFTPETLLCSPDKLVLAEQLLTAITPAQIGNVVPESLRRLKPVADANLAGNPWFLFANPGIAPNFVYGNLEGYEGPRLSSKERFSVQGMSVKLEHDFGVGGIDFRGGYRNPGA